MWIANADHIREIDRRTTDEFGVPARTLMERAGHAVFAIVREWIPTASHLTVFCGKGNNGGDGFVVARLARDHGYFTQVIVAAAESELGELAQEQMRIAREQGVCIVFAGDPCYARKLECAAHQDLIVDALLGTGARNEVQGTIREAIQAINRSGVPVLSIDVPSGIACDSGEELGESVWACRTVTIGLPKPCLFQGIGLEHSGFWQVADIGYPAELLEEPTGAKLIDPEWAGNLLPERLRASHKRENGSLLVVAGSRSMPGAAVMVAKAALRSGIGLLTVASVESVCAAVAAQVPEAMLMHLPERNGVVAPQAAEMLLGRQDSFTGACFGPGMTHEEPALRFLGEIWSKWSKSSVIDADGLNAVAKGVPLPRADCVLTPHVGELSRLLKLSVAEIESDRFKSLQLAVDRYRQCVLLKGPFTLIGERDQPAQVNTSGNPGMATGGMGDTLAGIIATLLAQDLPPYYAAACGAHWHGAAADLCACEIGPIGYTPEDVSNRLPAARVRILSSCESKPRC